MVVNRDTSKRLFDALGPELSLLYITVAELDLSDRAVYDCAKRALQAVRLGEMSHGLRALVVAAHLRVEYVTLFQLTYLIYRMLHNPHDPERALLALRCLTAGDQYQAGELADRLQETAVQEERLFAPDDAVKKDDDAPVWRYSFERASVAQLYSFARRYAMRHSKYIVAESICAVGVNFAYYSCLQFDGAWLPQIGEGWCQLTGQGGYGVAQETLSVPLPSKSDAASGTASEPTPDPGFKTLCFEIDQSSMSEESLVALALDGPYGYGRMSPLIQCALTLTDYYVSENRIITTLTSSQQKSFSGILYNSDQLRQRLRQLLDTQVVVVARVGVKRGASHPTLTIVSIQ